MFVENFPARYIADLTNRPKLKRKLKVVCACGNGTAGAFAPQVLEAVGCEVVRLDCELDHTFPELQSEHRRHEDAARHARRGAARTRRTSALGFDGDGDRCGVVDNEGEEIFADKVGVMLARDISGQHPNATFVADVKSTGLFMTDPVLQQERRQDRLLEDRPLLHEAARQRDRRAGGLREVRPLLLQQADRPRL